MTQKQKEKHSGFVGLWPLAKRMIYGAGVESTPKLRSYGQTTPNPAADSHTNYEAMKPEAYRWFRQDELVRRCIVINAAYATMAAGFETELESIVELADDAAEQAFQEKYKFVKDYVDAANRAVNLDRCLFVAQVKRSIFGKSGFEIEYAADAVRELVMSYFEHYYNLNAEKTLRRYSRPINLARFDRIHWMTAEEDLWEINSYLLKVTHFPVLTSALLRNLRRVDPRLYHAVKVGMVQR